MEPVLTTRRLVLRRARAAGAEAMHRILSSEEAMRYWSTEPHADLAQTAAWMEQMAAGPRAGETGDDFLVELQGRVIGKAGCYRDPEVGFIFDPAFGGRGFAREAVAAVVARAFEVRGLTRLTADVDPRNERSLALLAKLGFRATGRAARTFRIRGVGSHSVDLALHVGAWRSARHSAP